MSLPSETMSWPTAAATDQSDICIIAGQPMEVQYNVTIRVKIIYKNGVIVTILSSYQFIMETVTKRKFDFSIDSILHSLPSKRPKIELTELESEPEVKIERPESPSSTTLTDISSLSSSLSPTSFPQWTQCQRDCKKSRRPYSRQTVTILSWWFHHLPFLTVDEMEVVGGLTDLTRQQVKVWWQNRRHSQRGRSSSPDPYISHILHLPMYCDQVLPEPGNGYRQSVFREILNFYFNRVRSVIIPSSYFW